MRKNQRRRRLKRKHKQERARSLAYLETVLPLKKAVAYADELMRVAQLDPILRNTLFMRGQVLIGYPDEEAAKRAFDRMRKAAELLLANTELTRRRFVMKPRATGHSMLLEADRRRLMLATPADPNKP